MTKRLAQISSTIKTYRLPILAGILIGTSYIPFPPWAIFFCYVPLLVFCYHEQSLKKLWWGAWWTQFVLSFIGFNWIAHTVREFGFLPMPVSLVVLALFCATATLYLPISAVLWGYLCKKCSIKGFEKIALLAIIFALLEPLVPSIFPWNMGYPWLWGHFPGAQWADTFGFYGLSQITWIINLLIFWAWTHRSKLKVIGFTIVPVTLILFVLNWTGMRKAQQWPAPDRLALVQIVQANIGNQAKQYAEKGLGFQSFILDEYLRLVMQGKADLLNPQVSADVRFSIWPETAFPDMLGSQFRTRPYPARLHMFIDQHKIPMVVGSYTHDMAQNKVGNSIVFINDKNEYVGIPYSKSHLLVFGEYVPLGDRYPKLKEIFSETADFARGPGPHVTDFMGVKLGAQICYEALFPSFSLGLAKRGAEMVVNVTNDSWYGTWEEPFQHGWMTLGRAIEIRRPLVRATNTGISTVILANGEILEQSPMNQPWQRTYQIPFKKDPPLTFYTRYPWLMNVLLFSIGIILIFRAFLQRDRA